GWRRGLLAGGAGLWASGPLRGRGGGRPRRPRARALRLDPLVGPERPRPREASQGLPREPAGFRGLAPLGSPLRASRGDLLASRLDGGRGTGERAPRRALDGRVPVPEARRAEARGGPPARARGPGRDAFEADHVRAPRAAAPRGPVREADVSARPDARRPLRGALDAPEDHAGPARRGRAGGPAPGGGADAPGMGRAGPPDPAVHRRRDAGGDPRLPPPRHRTGRPQPHVRPPRGLQRGAPRLSRRGAGREL
ncbi:MAG: hypothetical protein AVDCRST_MAG05-4885, partial [uncultured Rubrobacteraceae bacterium]